MIGLGALILLAGIYLLVTGLLARSQLQTVRNDVRQLRREIARGDLAAARATAGDIVDHADDADGLTSGPVWWCAANLPGGGAALQTLRTITSQVAAVSRGALPQLVQASTRLDPATLRGPDGAIRLDPIVAAAPPLAHADAQLQRSTARIRARPAHTWLGVADSARRDLLAQLDSLAKTVHSADLAAHIAPAMLGADGPRRYFVAFQNDAEARGTGGIPGAFAIVRADHGTVRFERFEPDTALRGTPSGLDLGRDFAQLYGNAESTRLYVNSNLSPHFPYAARIWIAMWRHKTGEQLDGALALDPTALSYLLRATGPATLRDGSRVGAGNVVDLTQRRVYARFPERSQNPQRREFLLDVARSASRRLLATGTPTKRLLREAGRAAGARRLLAYSADPAVEAQLAQTSLGGTIPATDGAYAGLSIINDAGNKLDYYLDRSLTWQRTGCGSPREVIVTIRLTNNAPSSGLSPYVMARHDTHSYPVAPGDNRLEVGYLATRGALLRSVSVDGQRAGAQIGAERGHPVFTVDLEMPRGETRTIVLRLEEPDAPGPAKVLRQPLVRPLHVRVDDAEC